MPPHKYDMNTPFTYELLEISWTLDYDLEHEADTPTFADGSTIGDEPSPDSSDTDGNALPIEYDAAGIPMGHSPKENTIRKQIIFDFYEAWKASHPEKSVYNVALAADILIRQESVVEAAGHAARSYRSTLAVLRLDTLLANASLVDYDKPKPGNKNQEKLAKMILMSYRFDDIGLIKLTVGVRRRSGDKVQYGITAVEQGQQIVPASSPQKKKKAPHRK